MGKDTNADGIADYYEADVEFATDYYPYGMTQSGRSFLSSTYRFGFNGKENEQGWGNQTTQDYGFRFYNAAIARFLSVDPLAAEYPWYTPYQFAGNMPIWATDVDGLEPDHQGSPGDRAEAINKQNGNLEWFASDGNIWNKTINEEVLVVDTQLTEEHKEHVRIAREVRSRSSYPISNENIAKYIELMGTAMGAEYLEQLQSGNNPNGNIGKGIYTKSHYTDHAGYFLLGNMAVLAAPLIAESAVLGTISESGAMAAALARSLGLRAASYSKHLWTISKPYIYGKTATGFLSDIHQQALSQAWTRNGEWNVSSTLASTFIVLPGLSNYVGNQIQFGVRRRVDAKGNERNGYFFRVERFDASLAAGFASLGPGILGKRIPDSFSKYSKFALDFGINLIGNLMGSAAFGSFPSEEKNKEKKQ